MVDADTIREKNGSPPTNSNLNDGANPNELFKRMAENDDRQNKRLSVISSQTKEGKGSISRERTKMRFFVCTLGLLALTTSNMSRMVLNLCITQMVDSSAMTSASSSSSQVSQDGSCPWPEEQPSTVLPTTTTTELITAGPIETTTPVAQNISWTSETTEQIPSIISQGETLAVDEPPPDKFRWTMKQQSVLLGGFYYSYFVFMIIGGRMAEVYGSKYVLVLSVAGSAIINLATPWMARTSFELLVFSRVVMGAIQSGVFPGMYALFAKWLTMSEASIYAPLIKVNLRLGMMIGTTLPGILPDWPSVFYFSGLVCAVWSAIWILFAKSTPQESRFVSKAELYHIMKKKPKPKEESVDEVEMKDYKENSKPKEPTKSMKTPWLKIITAPSVVGLIFVKLTFNYALDFIAILLPSYLKYVHHASRQQISMITTSVFSMQVVLVVFVGWLAKYMVDKKPFGMTKTGVRKSFQALASYGLGALLILCSYNDCNLTLLGILLQITSFLSMFTAGGETMLPYDLSHEYPATIMAIANSIANLSGVTTTTLAGVILGDQGGSYDRWNILIRLIGGANIIGGFAFSLLVKAEPIDFDGKSKDVEADGSTPRDVKVLAVSAKSVANKTTNDKQEESGTNSANVNNDLSR